MKKRIIILVLILILIVMLFFFINVVKNTQKENVTQNISNVEYNENTGLYTIKNGNKEMKTEDEVLIKIYEQDIEYNPKIE